MAHKQQQISERVWNANQSWYYERTVRCSVTPDHSPDTLRISIRRNAYDDQSSAEVERWTPDGWKSVVWQAIQFCECKGLSYAKDGVRASDFHNDGIALLKEALAVLHG